MNQPKTLRELLSKGSGRNRADVVADAVEQRPELFHGLVEIYLSGEEPVSRVAAWATDLCAERHPGWIIPYADRLVGLLPRPGHTALKRHALRMLSRIEVPQTELGPLIGYCFTCLTSANLPAAPKVYAMEILYRISLAEPDLRQELTDTIMLRLDEETAGFRNRGLKILKKISR